MFIIKRNSILIGIIKDKNKFLLTNFRDLWYSIYRLPGVGEVSRVG